MRRKSGSRDVLTKVYAIGRDVEESASRQDREDDQESVHDRAHAIEPPLDPESVVAAFEGSNSLRQNIDSYAVNIDGFGHRLDPLVDLDDEDADEKIANVILMERLHEAEGKDKKPELKTLIPKPEEVKSRKESVELEMRVEKLRLENFFAFAAQDMSFPALRMLTRQDLELLGYAFWEVLRNNSGNLARFIHVPAWTVRLRKLAKDPIEVQEPYPISAFSYTKISVRRRFRTFVQMAETGPVYFKEFGDPRTVSRKTGKVFADAMALKAEEPNADPATELIYFEIKSPRSPYGVPRWIGNMASVLGSREAEEVNLAYFKNKAVPPLAILVSGGRLSKSSVPLIEDFVENRLKGKKNFHKIMVIEAVSPRGRSAESGPHPPRPMIELKPLMEAQQQDALFQTYDERNMDKVGGAFRLPRLLRGESKDFNRATAEAALRMAEEQVFQPLRDEFDFFVNRSLLPALDAHYHRYVSNSPVTRDPEMMGKIAAEMVKQGILTPAEGRILAADIFNRAFAVIKQPWAKQPIQFTLAGIQTGQSAPVAAAKGDLAGLDAGKLKPAQGDPPKIPTIAKDEELETFAQLLLRVREKLIAQEDATERAKMAAERGETITIEVTPEEMDQLIERE